MKGMIPESETGIIEMKMDGEDIHITFVRVTNTCNNTYSTYQSQIDYSVITICHQMYYLLKHKLIKVNNTACDLP